jgi:hypothetical protein
MNIDEFDFWVVFYPEFLSEKKNGYLRITPQGYSVIVPSIAEAKQYSDPKDAKSAAYDHRLECFASILPPVPVVKRVRKTIVYQVEDV